MKEIQGVKCHWEGPSGKWEAGYRGENMSVDNVRYFETVVRYGIQRTMEAGDLGMKENTRSRMGFCR